jgi:hypothetical protein
MADDSYQTKNYEKQGGDEWVIGGTLTVGGIAFTTDGTNIIVTGLPTADPHVVGALWANSAVLTVSAG